MHTTPIRRGDPTVRPSRRAKALVALGTASLALIAAVPASAANDKPPVDKNGKKSCLLHRVSEPDGSTWDYYVPHGTTLKITMWNGGAAPKTRTCDDGEWKYQRTAHDGGIVGGTRGALDGGSVSAKVVRVSPSQLRHAVIAPR